MLSFRCYLFSSFRRLSFVFYSYVPKCSVSQRFHCKPAVCICYGSSREFFPRQEHRGMWFTIDQPSIVEPRRAIHRTSSGQTVRQNLPLFRTVKIPSESHFSLIPANTKRTQTRNHEQIQDMGVAGFITHPVHQAFAGIFENLSTSKLEQLVVVEVIF